MARVVLEKVNKVYDDGFHAVHDLDLDVQDGEFLVLVGPSGCGKSTALRTVAGLETITSGTLRIGDRIVNDLEPKDRDIAFVFQNYALYPHMSVRQNIGFALKLRRTPKKEIDTQVEQAAALLQLTEHLDRKPGELSGGQRQRVAMGRAIVRRPQVFLMDEPLSNLDAKLRVQMRAEISRLQRDLGVTTIYVTHDQVEAMTMGDRVAVLSAGALQQLGTPQHLYDSPANLFVAAFIGSPQMNLLDSVLHLDGDPHITISGQRLDVLPSVLDARPALRAHDGQELVVGIRPEALDDATLVADPNDARTLDAVVDLREGLGSEVVAHARIDAKAPAIAVAVAGVTEEPLLEEGGGVQLVARLDPKTTVQMDHTARFVVDLEALHFFDSKTGLAIGDEG